MTQYCAQCGTERPAADLLPPCVVCGARRTTPTAPSQEPCAYCGARPTWPVVWTTAGQTETVWLCASCDQREAASLMSER